MLNLQLFIEGQEVDLFEDESVTLTQTIQDVKDIEKVFTDYSRTFNVPASKINNKIFKHFYNYHIIGYDARKKKEAELHLNYKLFKKGKIKLEGATRKDNKAHTYKITFFGNGINLKDLIGDDKLDALAMLKKDSFKFTYNDANILSYMQNGLDIVNDGVTYENAILFPLITHTKRLVYDSAAGSAYLNTDTQNNIAYESGSEHGLQLSQIKPALRIYPIIKAIEEQYGLTFSTDFFNTTNEPFYDLYLWLHNKTGGLFEDEGNVTPVENFNATKIDGATIDLYTNYFTTPQSDQVGTTQGRKQREIKINIKPSVTNEFNFVIYKNGETFERFDNIQRDSNTLDYTIDFIDIDAGDYTFAIESDTPSTYEFIFDVKRKTNSGLGYRNIIFEATSEVLTDVQFRPANQLPDIKVLDFITSLFKMFNLTSFQNDSGIIEVKTLDKFYESSTKIWNITENIDKSESSVDSVLPYKQVNLRYEGLENFFAKNHSELFNQEWGTLKYEASSKFEGSAYTITIPLEHFKYERLKDVNGDSFTDLQWGWSADIKQEPNLGKPLLFYPIQQNAQIGVIKSNGDLASHTGVYLPSNSIDLTDSNNLNFNAEPNEFALLPFEKTLFSEYYKNYVKEIFDPQRRLTTVKAYLPLSLTINLTLADKIQIFENLYRINKVSTNFETNQSSLELINIKEKAGELIQVIPTVPDKFVPSNTCITIDTTIFYTDTTLVKTDSYCIEEGLKFISTDEVVPNDVSPTNTPDQVLIDTPLIVTPPILSSAIQPNPTANSLFLKYSVSELGSIGATKQIDEYGFFYSTDANDLVSTDIDTLKANSNVTNVPYRTSSFNRNTIPNNITFEVTGLTNGTVIYWKFYGRTNISQNYSFADAITEVKSNATLTGCTDLSYNTLILRNDETTSITYTYLDNGVEQNRTAAAGSESYFTGCICISSLVATGNYTVIVFGDTC